MRYTGTMANPLIASIRRNFDDALQRMAAAITACPGELWTAELWPGEPPAQPPPAGAVGSSAPWFLAYHALSCLDYDLTGDFERWQPPPPFESHIWGWPSRVFTKDELLAYVDWCRDHARRTLDALTDDAAARPLPATHRYRGTPYVVLIGNIPLHVVEHAAQIRQFVAATQPQARP